MLGSDLYQIASGIRDEHEDVIEFFNHIYENTPLTQLLKQQSHRDIENLAGFEAGARDAFLELNQAFSAFLSTTGALRDLDHLELYKIVLGGFGNLHEIAGRKNWTASLEQAVQAIKAHATDCIQRLLPRQCGRVAYG